MSELEFDFYNNFIENHGHNNLSIHDLENIFMMEKRNEKINKLLNE
jgi:hypothetical protein